jgi:ligand-binding sensor domain-containing protein
VTRWTTDQGLPQNRISCLKQTRDGYLWLGTWFGLARFDGARFTVFDKFNTPELVNDAINAVAEDTVDKTMAAPIRATGDFIACSLSISTGS